MKTLVLMALVVALAAFAIVKLVPDDDGSQVTAEQARAAFELGRQGENNAANAIRDSMNR